MFNLTMDEIAFFSAVLLMAITAFIIGVLA
jgi:hypothetical protein